jgi:hypothetical protein
VLKEGISPPYFQSTEIITVIEKKPLIGSGYTSSSTTQKRMKI